MRGLLISTEFLGALLFIFVVVFPPFDDASEVNLSIHMLQHVLVVISGAMIAYPFFKKGKVPRGPAWAPKALLLASAAIIVFWHLPSQWDAAILNPLVHAAEHLSFLVVGLLVGSVLQELSDSAKIGALLAAFFGHMAYAALLVAPFNIQVYPLFSLADQATLGWVLLLSGWSFLVGVAYLLSRNPSWLAGISGKTGAKPSEVRRQTWSKGTPAWLTPAASISLIAVLVIYFAATTVAVAAAPNPLRPGAVVFVVETPVSWQYSPQDIKVRLGVNSTVTWVSRSVSYDTITANSGLFDSGAIPPGGSFSFAFNQPGVYAYHCLYHPWMVGSVTVLPKA